MASVLGSGNLNNGTIDGRRNANLNNGLSNSNWNYAARISAQLRCAVFRSLKGNPGWAGAECPKLTNQHRRYGNMPLALWRKWTQMGASSKPERP